MLRACVGRCGRRRRSTETRSACDSSRLASCGSSVRCLTTGTRCRIRCWTGCAGALRGSSGDEGEAGGRTRKWELGNWNQEVVAIAPIQRSTATLKGQFLFPSSWFFCRKQFSNPSFPNPAPPVSRKTPRDLSPPRQALPSAAYAPHRGRSEAPIRRSAPARATARCAERRRHAPPT